MTTLTRETCTERNTTQSHTGTLASALHGISSSSSTICRLCSKTLQQLAGQALQTRRGFQHSHVPGRQAHEVVWMLRRMVDKATEGQIPIFVMDCDVAAAVDHVSHHEAIRATLAMVVPLVLIAASVREYRNSETQVKLDDIVTLGIRRTSSVPPGDPCAADCSGQPWTHQVRSSVICAKTKKRGCLWEAVTLVFCSSQTLAGSSRSHQESSKQWQERGTNC